MISTSDISKLINKNKWTKILHYLVKKRINPNTKLSNGNFISHIASANNKNDIIEFYLENNKNILSKLNDDGHNSYHIMAKYGYFDLLKRSILHDKDSINLPDENGNTILHYLAQDNNKHFEWVIDNIPNIDYNIVNNSGETLLNKCIYHSNDISDIYFDRITLLIKNGSNINHPNNNIPLINSIKQHKSYIANRLIKEGANINIKDDNYLTPFLLSVYNGLDSTVKLLIDNKVDVNYFGAEGDNNPLNLALSRGNDTLSDIILENGFDIKKYDRDMNTPLHIAFILENKLKPSTVSKLLFYGDLNHQNMNGDTPLHLFLKKYNWMNYDKILENKEMDIFIKNYVGKKPIDYIQNKDLVNFLNLVTQSFMHNYKQIDSCSRLQNIKCFNKTKEYILKNKISYYNENSNTEEKEDIKLIIGPNVNMGKFNSDILHNIIYTTIILERNKNLGIPFQYFNKSKASTVKMLLDTTSFLYNSPEEEIMSELINIYHEYFFEIAPYLILWKGKNLYYIDKNIDFYTQKCLNSDKIRFIFFKLTLITSKSGTHANMVLFDKKTNILERFEPYGIIPYLDNDDIDNMIKNEIGGFITKHLKNKKIKYYSPSDLFSGVSFQILSDDGSTSVKKLGDPTGYCLAWVFWYTEMRIKNPTVDPKNLIEKALGKIKNINKIKYRKQIFIDFIRNYAAGLDKAKNKILLKAGISEQNLYNLQFSNEDNNNIFKLLIKKINNIVASRT